MGAKMLGAFSELAVGAKCFICFGLGTMKFIFAICE
jgi:hypothetical protein